MLGNRKFQFIVLASFAMGLNAQAQNTTATSNQMPPEMAQVDCKALAEKATPLVEQCLKISVQEGRAQCWQDVGNNLKIGDAAFKSCESVLGPIAKSFQEKEKAKYPNQASAFIIGGGNRAPANDSSGKTMPPNGNMALPQGNSTASTGATANNAAPSQQISQQQCKDLATKAAPLAEQCLKISAQESRAQCWDDIGKTLGMNQATEQACGSVLMPLGQSFQAKEKAKYPTQGQAFKMGGNPGGGSNSTGSAAGNGNLPANNQSSPAGSSTAGVNSGITAGANQNTQVSPQQCKEIAAKAAPLAEQCLKISAQQSRAQCWNDIGRTLNINDAITQACSAAIMPVANSFQAKEKAKYPKQEPAFTMGGNGSKGTASNANSQPSAPPAPSTAAAPSSIQSTAAAMVDCGSLISKVKASAVKCLAMSNQANRKKCFEGIGKTVDSNPNRQSCQGPLDQLKSEVQSQEKQKYPKQPSAAA